MVEVIIQLLLAALFITFLLKLYLHHPKKSQNQPVLSSQITATVSHNLDMDAIKEEIVVETKSDELEQVFHMLDKNHDGFLSKQELRESLHSVGFSANETDVDDIVKGLDCNGDGLVDFDEFRALFKTKDQESDEKEQLGRVVDEKEEELKEAFDVFDGNKDGLITEQELGSVLSSLGFAEGRRVEDCKEMISKVDVDGDGMVNFHEFKTMMKGNSCGLV
ncbi:hypothetical protein Droror1_Dr00023872 [Drosera rotundifolia]